MAVQMESIFLPGVIGARVLIALAAIVIAAATRCNAADCLPSTLDALLEFRSAFREPSGKVFSSWDAARSTDCCAWAGITCGQNSNVVSIDVEGPSGTTSAQVARNQSYTDKPGHTLSKLRDLQTLKLKNLQFSSKIPSQWDDFSDSLIAITVNNCDLQDSIPSGIASNSHLQTLDLKSNNLSGDIPSKLCDLENLKYLDLSYNDLDTSSAPSCVLGGGSITSVNYGHQSTNTGSGTPGDGGYGPYNSASRIRRTASFFESCEMILLVPSVLSLLQYYCLV